MRQRAEGFPQALHLQGDPFDQMLPRADLVITSASSVGMEAIGCSIPAIIIAGPQGLIHNPIPEEISMEIWQFCHTSEEIQVAIDGVLPLNQLQIARDWSKSVL